MRENSQKMPQRCSTQLLPNLPSKCSNGLIKKSPQKRLPSSSELNVHQVNWFNSFNLNDPFKRQKRITELSRKRHRSHHFTMFKSFQFLLYGMIILIATKLEYIHASIPLPGKW